MFETDFAVTLEIVGAVLTGAVFVIDSLRQEGAAALRPARARKRPAR